MKTKNLNDFLKKRTKRQKVVEDSNARESILLTINKCGEGRIDFQEEEEIQSDNLSSDVLSCEIDSAIYSVIDSNIRDSVIKDKDIKDNLLDNNLLDSAIDNNLLDSPLEQSTSLQRINKIKQFTSLNIHIDQNKLSSYLLLPPSLLRLSKIFKALLTVQRYNQVRKLTSIFVKARGSIERTLKTRVEEEDIKRLYFLLPQGMELKRLCVEEKGEKVNTFTFSIRSTGEEIDKRLLEFYKTKGEAIPMKEIDSEESEESEVLDKGHLSSVPLISPLSSMPLISPLSSMPLISPLSSMPLISPLSSMPLISPTSPLATPPQSPVSTGESALKRTNSILERIKERERMRKEAFVKKMGEKNEDRNLLKRIVTLFKKEGKQAMKLKEIVKVLDIYEGNKQIQRIVEDSSTPLEIKRLANEEHVIYKEK